MSGRGQVAGEAGRFVAVGAAATVAAAVLFNVLVHGLFFFDGPLDDHPFLGYVLANAVGMVVSYAGSRHFAFRHRAPVHADGGVTAYVVINVLTMALPVACLWVSRSVLGLSDPVSDNVAANGIGLTLGFWARFYLFRRFVFPPAGVADVVRGSALGLPPAPQVGPLVAELGGEVA